MKVKSESEVAQSCPTLSDPKDCSPTGFSVHGIFQARVLECKTDSGKLLNGKGIGSVLFDNPDGWDEGGVGGRFKREVIHIYI